MLVTVLMEASSDLPTYEEGQLERPKWAGEITLSRLVGALITFKPISSVLKFGARQVLIRMDYLNPFHANDEGNLSWLTAAEAEAANLSMTEKAIPYASSVDETDLMMRGNWLQAIEQYHQQYSGEIRDILDIGCSVGVSTKHFADKLPSAKVTELPPVLFTLMKSTEPFLDEYLPY